MNKIAQTMLIALALAVAAVIQIHPLPAYAQLPTKADTTDRGDWSLTLVPLECQTGDGCDICEVTKIFTNAADIVASVLSAIALLMFVLGGFFLIFSAGNPSRVETGKKILIGTISGLAVVFLAWIAVNIIVRTTSITGGNKSTDVIFTDAWWKFDKCYPDLPTSCVGHFVTESCSTTSCTSSSKDPNCFCYRAVGTGSNLCGGDEDATSIDNVLDVDTNKKNQCICTDTCTVYAKTSEKAYTCVPDATIAKAKVGTYILRETATCQTADTTCALLKTTK
jgi:hypothetical protein